MNRRGAVFVGVGSGLGDGGSPLARYYHGKFVQTKQYGQRCKGGASHCTNCVTLYCLGNGSGGVTAIDANAGGLRLTDGGVLWGALYGNAGVPYGLMLSGGSGGLGHVPPPPYSGIYLSGDFITALFLVGGNQIWLGGGGINGASGYPAKVPASCGGYPSSQCDYLRLSPRFDRNVWGAAAIQCYSTGCTSATGVVFEFDESGNVISTLKLPAAMGTEIATARDNSLWLPIPAHNAIARVADGCASYTEFSIPTPDAGPQGITLGPDRALWFTEANADKIGRIDLKGHISEYSLPTANSLPVNITAYLALQLQRHFTVWAFEQGPAKLARIDVAP